MKVLRMICLSILVILFNVYGCTYSQDIANESYYRGIEYATQGKFKKAKEEFEKALKIDPLFKPAEFNLVIIKDVIEGKIKREATIHLFKGISYANKGRYDRAISDYTEAIEINPKYTEAYNNRGFVYLVNLGNNVKGCADFKKTCDLGDCGNYNITKQKGYCR